MAGMLNHQQTEEVKRIRRLIRRLDIDGWMCEGADDERLVFFNNEEDKIFYADYFGNITSTSYEVPADVRKYAELEGKIAQICYLD